MFTVIDGRELRDDEASGEAAEDPSEAREGFVGAEVTVRVDEIAWTSGRLDAPKELRFITGGYTFHDGERRRVLYEGGLWLEPGTTFFAVLADFGVPGQPDLSPMSRAAVYELDGDGRVRAPDTQRGAQDFGGLTVGEIGQMLSRTSVDPAVEPYLDLPAQQRFGGRDAPDPRDLETATSNEPE